MRGERVQSLGHHATRGTPRASVAWQSARISISACVVHELRRHEVGKYQYHGRHALHRTWRVGSESVAARQCSNTCSSSCILWHCETCCACIMLTTHSMVRSTTRGMSPAKHSSLACISGAFVVAANLHVSSHSPRSGQQRLLFVDYSIG